MADDRSVSRLVEAGVLTEQGAELALTSDLVAAIDDRADSLAGADGEQLLAAVRDAADPGDDSERILAALDQDPRRVARFLALRSATDLPTADSLQATLLVEQFERPEPPSEGAPEGFLPLHGDQLPLALALARRSIVYVWREDCDPCDTMREEFDDIFGASGDDELGLYAVAGPEAPEFLYERYRVGGAPTTLFVLDGEVDCRLEGAHYRSVIDTEIETLREVPA